MSTRYESFLTEVLPYVPDCPEIVAVNAIRNACIEFCDKSLYWLYNHDPVTTIDNVATYELELPDFTASVAVLDAWHDNLPLVPVGEDTIKKVYPLNWPTLMGAPKYLTQQNPNEVILVPYPQTGIAQGLNMIMAIKPTRDSVDIDDSIYENWAEGIGFGARARIHALPNQSFSDPVAAAKYDALFRIEIGKATVTRNRGLSRAVQRVRPPRFF